MDLLYLLSFGDTGWGDELLHGLFVTLALSIVTFPISIVLSFLVNRAKLSKFGPVRIAGKAYTTVFKSLPEILTLLILYYQSQALIVWVLAIFWPDSNFSMSPFVAGVIALSLVISSYGSEVIRASVNAVGKGQFEAAKSLGLSPFNTFFKVILPQLWRHALPGFGNLWVILLKDTSLVSIVTLSDMTHIANQAINTTREPFFFYVVISIVYITLVMTSMTVQKRLEKRAARGFVPMEANNA